jgi:integrase
MSSDIVVMPPQPSAVDLAVAAWLHAKGQRSGSRKTVVGYSAIIAEFRDRLLAQGIDLDAADPRQVRRLVHESQVAEQVAARETQLALAAQAFAAQPAQTRYGPRPVAATTANLRLAALSSFYSYALRQGIFQGTNPIQRVERRRVQSYASARPLARETLPDLLGAIDVTTPAGRRDYALLLLGLHTGRRLSELAALRRDALVIRKTHIEITWPRTKGGKTMRDELPLHGPAALAAQALIAWLQWLAEDQSTADQAVGPYQPAAPVWISLARNGTYGQSLSIRSIATICEQRLGTSKVHALRHTFARALEDAGAKVSDIQARLGHASLDTTGRYLAQLHQGENPHLDRLATLYGLAAPDTAAGKPPEQRAAPEAK